jgi:hypothetical protein
MRGGFLGEARVRGLGLASGSGLPGGVLKRISLVTLRDFGFGGELMRILKQIPRSVYLLLTI